MGTLASGSSPIGDRGGLARESALNLLGALAATITNFGIVVVVTRGSTPTTAGTFFAVISAFLLGSTVARLGTNTGLVFFIARSRVADSAGSPGRLVRLACRPVFALTVALTTSVWIWAPELGRLMLGDNPSPVVGMLRVLALALPAGVLHEVFLSATRGYRQMAPTILIARIGIPLGQLLCLVGVVLTGGSSTSLAIAWAAPYVPALFGGWWAWQRTLKKSGGASAGQGGMTAGMFWRFTGPRAISSIAQLAMARADILLVAAIRGPVEAAIYTAATRFVVVGQFVVQALSMGVQPRIAELASTADYEEAGRLYRLATTWLVLLTWPLYLTTAVLASQVLTLFGDAYRGREAVAVVTIMSLAMLVATGSGMVEVFLNMAGQSAWTLMNALVALSTMIGLDLLLIRPYGAVGASVAWATAIAVQNTVALGMLFRAYGLHPFGRAWFLATGASLLGFVLIPAAGAVSTPGSLTGLAGGLGVGLGVFVVVVVRRRDVLQTAVLLRQVRERQADGVAAEPLSEGMADA